MQLRVGDEAAQGQDRYQNTKFRQTEVYAAFAGLGQRLILPGDYSINQRAQTAVGLSFMRALQRGFGGWTMNEILCYCIVINETIQGKKVAIKDIALELGVAMSTASNVVKKLQRVGKVDVYSCPLDKRRHLLRLHARTIERRLSGADDWAAEVRTDLIRIFREEGNSHKA